MKVLACLVVIWLICGAVAAFVVEDYRSIKLSDIALGPIALVRDTR